MLLLRCRKQEFMSAWNMGTGGWEKIDRPISAESYFNLFIFCLFSWHLNKIVLLKVMTWNTSLFNHVDYGFVIIRGILFTSHFFVCWEKYRKTYFFSSSPFFSRAGSERRNERRNESTEMLLMRVPNLNKAPSIKKIFASFILVCKERTTRYKKSYFNMDMRFIVGCWVLVHTPVFLTNLRSVIAMNFSTFVAW